MLPAAATPFFYLAFAAALLWATWRFIRPLSPWAAVGLTLLPLAFTAPALLTGRVYGPVDLYFRSEPLVGQRERFGLSDDDFSRSRHDVAFQMIPWRKAARYAISEGEWPIWNPFILSGDVLAASEQPAVYHPIHVAAYLLSLGQSLTFVATAVFFAAGLSAFLFNREIGCREGAAITGAAGWMFCGFMLFWLGWPHVLTAAFFPLLLLAVRRVARSPGWPAAALLTLAFVLMLLGGHPETAFHAIAVAMIFGLHEMLTAPGRAPRAVIGYSAVAGVTALMLTAIDLLPFIEALRQTTHYHSRGASQVTQAVSWGLALERLRVAVVPFAYGFPWSEWIRLPSKFGAHWYAYVGSVLFAPALYGLWRGRWRGRWLLAGLAGLCLLIFVAAPGLIDWIARLPLFDKAINRRLVFVTGFAVTVLAALGLEAWAEAKGAAKRHLGWLTLAVLATLALALALFWPGLRKDGLSTAFLWSRTWLELLPVALAGALFLTVRSARIALAGLLLVLVAQRVAQTGELNRTFSEDLVAPPVAALRRLPTTGPPFRILGYKKSFTPGTNTLYELEDARGNTPMTNRRLFSTYKLWSKDKASRLIPRVDDLSRPFLSFLNVRYALIAKGQARPEDWKRASKGRGFVIYENPGVLPRAFVPRQVRLVAPDEQRIWREMAEETDFSEVAWIELPDLETPSRKARQPNGPGQVTVERRGLGLDLRIRMERPGWVVVSQTAWKGWRAISAGEEIPVHFANHAFLGFHLPEGEHRVDLVYRPRSFIVGRAVSLLTAAFLVAFVLARGAAARKSQGSEAGEAPLP